MGYARVSTEQQDPTVQRDGPTRARLRRRSHLRRPRPDRHKSGPAGSSLAMAACRAANTLVATKLDRLARSLPDARDILDELARRNVKLSLGGMVHDPTDRSVGCCSRSSPWWRSSKLT